MLSRLGHQGTTWIPRGASQIPYLSHTGSSFVSSTMRCGKRQGNDASGDGLPDSVRRCFRHKYTFYQKTSGTLSRENPLAKPSKAAPPPRLEKTGGIFRVRSTNKFPSSLFFRAKLRPIHSCPETRRLLTSPGREWLPTIPSLVPVPRTRLELRLN